MPDLDLGVTFMYLFIYLPIWTMSTQITFSLKVAYMRKIRHVYLKIPANHVSYLSWCLSHSDTKSPKYFRQQLFEVKLLLFEVKLQIAFAKVIEHSLVLYKEALCLHM